MWISMLLQLQDRPRHRFNNMIVGDLSILCLAKPKSPPLNLIKKSSILDESQLGLPIFGLGVLKPPPAPLCCATALQHQRPSKKLVLAPSEAQRAESGRADAGEGWAVPQDSRRPNLGGWLAVPIMDKEEIPQSQTIILKADEIDFDHVNVIRCKIC